MVWRVTASKHNHRPRIGVTVSNKGSYLTWLCHWLAVTRAGGKAVRLMVNGRTNFDGLDGFVIGGGDDISAELYGGELTMGVRIDPDRDALEQRAVRNALEKNLPVLGICRGSQMINIELGGTLHQDIYTKFDDVPEIRTVLPKKIVDIEAGSKLSKILGIVQCKVNSLHHQAVDNLGDGMKIVARDRHDIIQGTEHAERDFLIGVQWHPEFLIFEWRQQALFRHLVRAAKKRITKP